MTQNLQCPEFIQNKIGMIEIAEWVTDADKNVMLILLR